MKYLQVINLQLLHSQTLTFQFQLQKLVKTCDGRELKLIQVSFSQFWIFVLFLFNQIWLFQHFCCVQNFHCSPKSDKSTEQYNTPKNFQNFTSPPGQKNVSYKEKIGNTLVALISNIRYTHGTGKMNQLVRLHVSFPFL